MIRIIDFTAALVGLIILSPILLALFILVWSDNRAPLFSQKRVGRNKKPFTLIKFRTMNVGTKAVATHLVEPASVTRLGAFMRKTKIDEIPQLWNVLCGDMSLVGPRPSLYSQEKVIEERTALKIYDRRPGITGLSQIRGVDMSTPQLLARTDFEMLQNFNIRKYFIYIYLTIIGKGQGDKIRSKA